MEVLYIITNGTDSVSANSFITGGCTESCPGDLLTFSFLSFFHNLFLRDIYVIYNSFIVPFFKEG